MSNPTPADDRRTAYAAKFGSAHPTDAVVLAWARELFPERGNLRFRRGLFKCQIKDPQNPLKPVTRHLKRIALMSGNAVLGVGTDAVEAVAAADIQNKRLLAARAAEKPTKTQE